MRHATTYLCSRFCRDLYKSCHVQSWSVCDGMSVCFCALIVLCALFLFALLLLSTSLQLFFSGFVQELPCAELERMSACFCALSVFCACLIMCFVPVCFASAVDVTAAILQRFLFASAPNQRFLFARRSSRQFQNVKAPVTS
jgi:hypothetical protein